jgi:hypothetical protein
LFFSVTWRVQIGIRLVLPLVVLGIVGLAAAVVQAWRAGGSPWKARLLSAWAAVSIAWTATASIAVWPNALCFVNGLWGGTRNGYRIVSDANYDWGQGLRELARWQQERRPPSLDVWYFGTDPLLKRLPMRLVSLHVLPIERPEDVLHYVKGHYLAASTTLLYGESLNNPALERAAQFLRSCKPVSRTTTFLIYDFTGTIANEKAAVINDKTMAGETEPTLVKMSLAGHFRELRRTGGGRCESSTRTGSALRASMPR